MRWAKGQQLKAGQYIIEEVLGQGGFGITYKAVHESLNQLVVIKTPNDYLKYEADYNKYVERFIKEGQILARLSETHHPHIVAVRELFRDGDTYCLVMDFVSGKNLFDVVKQRGRLLEREAVRCICQIGEALAFIHQAGLVHRDAHPGNIILCENGQAVLIDFGISKELTPSTQTSTGDAGNRGFAPYEQLAKGSREPTVDVYCLAATLYYAVTAQRPPTSLERKLNNVALIAPKQIVPEISNRLNQAILWGMALEPEDRPKSMLDWLKVLDLEGNDFSFWLTPRYVVSQAVTLFRQNTRRRFHLIFSISILVFTLSLFAMVRIGIQIKNAVSVPKLLLNGEVVKGVLSGDDISDHPLDKTYSDVYVVEGRKGQQLTIEMSSKAFDPYLILRQSDGSQLAYKDDISPMDFNAKIVVTLPKDDIYTVIARSSAPGEVGSYSLKAMATEPSR
ncbi:protein kinase domain-containing protein [Coleofasciculus sp. E2-BRE-01]|uniref:protein kinase domain-containing protein n=1 Tax=Coleofasciculus sp. E2-BRE-01 TaxID=3069524 RepID=UPI0032FD3CFC